MANKILKNLKTIVFAGGGGKCLSYVGALQELRDSVGIDFGANAKTNKKSLERIVCVSAGGLIGLCILIGYSVAELTEFSSLTTHSDVFNTDLMRIISGEISLDDGQKLRHHIEKILMSKQVDIRITFKELFIKFGIVFEVYVTDLKNCCVKNISYENYPDLSVVEGMAASMAVPLVYPPVKMPDGEVWIDAGILNNFPIGFYKSDSVIGFDFLSELSTECKIDSLLPFIMRVINVQNAPLEKITREALSQGHINRSIIIDARAVTFLKTISEEMSLLTREALLKAGKDAMANKISDWNKI
jgi:predicted acylesterase/phospholipase RssA